MPGGGTTTTLELCKANGLGGGAPPLQGRMGSLGRGYAARWPLVGLSAADVTVGEPTMRADKEDNERDGIDLTVLRRAAAMLIRLGGMRYGAQQSAT
jgi:hypothetical protein